MVRGVIYLFAQPFKEVIKYTRDLYWMETFRSGLIFTFTTYNVFGVVPFPYVSIWFIGKSAALRCRFPGLGLGGPFIFVKGIGWTCESRLVKSRCTVRACLRCWVKARSGPGCSKLTTSLVNVSLKFQMLISQIHQYFC